jgi:tetratricopeptide (TPR) repeat protein
LDLYYCTLARHQAVDWAEQAEVLARAVQADAGDRASRLALAESLRRLGRLEQAESTLDLLDTADSDARSVRALIALDRGDVGRAEAMIGTDSRAEGDPALARLRGRLALARDDARAAVGHFRAALNVLPDDRDTHFGLAQALRLAGEPEAARSHAEAARAHDRLESLVKSARAPDRQKDTKILQAIAEACLALNRRNLARAWYRLALSHEPANEQLKSVLSRLR